METKTVSVLSNADNNAVIKLADCDYLGSVVPVDTLFLMHGEAMDLVEELKHNPGSDVFYAAYSLAKGIEQRLEHVIDVCQEQGINPGFAIELSVYDYQDLLI